ncbi:acetoin utilization protein AcuC [Candidatus Geothermarchaeota archaeon]|nr:MAG: acetoin utilization protein AcuC [Candidatus Geothermarchaeota archaeon]RLG62828.1 MAG: acetoin utilization protein AcuC [Candidatus Geothermarchaeota archaeon]HEW94436.1 acetoin utilization protein AcuC [Thermoprotei archaeon]
MKVYLYMNERLYQYGFPNHPLNPTRYRLFKKYLEESKIDKNLEIVSEYPCNEEILKYFHAEEYIKYVKRKSEEGVGLLDYGDTPAYKGVYEVSLESACATLDAAKKALKQKTYTMNPSGGWHHSRRDRAAGFCVFNDIGVAIEYLFSHGLAGRVYYIDIDAHHGDGVYYSFEDDPRVYIFDIHESGVYLYPGTGFEWEDGRGAARGSKRNRALDPGDGDDILLKYIDEAVEWGFEIEPDLIIMQGGMDGLAGDPLTHLRYSVDGYLSAVERVLRLSRDLGVGLVYLGGGGYQPEVQAKTWIRVLETMLKLSLT